MNGAELHQVGKRATTPHAYESDEAETNILFEHPGSSVAAKGDGTPSKPLGLLQRRWRTLSPFWRRATLASLLLFTVIIITLIVILAVVLRPRATSNRPAIASNGQTDSTTASEFSAPPFKLGLLTNFPDPALYYDKDSSTWYAFATNQAAGILSIDRSASDLSHLSLGNIQLATSTDFMTWNLVNMSNQPLPDPGMWTKAGTTNLSSLPSRDGSKYDDKNGQVTLKVPRANVWAPELLHRPSDSKWVLYYAATDSEEKLHCIGAGISSTPNGPFEPVDQPLFCPKEKNGAIDPAVFIDELNDNKIYMAYKVASDGLGHGGECNNMVEPIEPTPIMLQRMQDDGVTKDTTFEPVQLLDRIAEDGPLIEAPSLVRAGHNYFLFYSSRCTKYEDYTLRYAHAPNLTGPYTRAEPALVKTGDFGLHAPGSASIRYAADSYGFSPEGTTGSEGSTAGTWKVALHGRVNTTIGGVRALFTAGLEFQGTSVKVIDGRMAVT